MKDLGHRLKTIRISKKMEVAVVVELIGVSESTYRRYERGESEPTITILQKIAKAYGLDVKNLLDNQSILVLPPLK